MIVNTPVVLSETQLTTLPPRTRAWAQKYNYDPKVVCPRALAAKIRQELMTIEGIGPKRAQKFTLVIVYFGDDGMDNTVNTTIRYWATMVAHVLERPELFSGPVFYNKMQIGPDNLRKRDVISLRLQFQEWDLLEPALALSEALSESRPEKWL